MTQISVDALIARAKAASLTMSQVCAEAGVSESTVSRARGGADMKIGTMNKLAEAIARLSDVPAKAV